MGGFLLIPADPRIVVTLENTMLLHIICFTHAENPRTARIVLRRAAGRGVRA